MTKFKYQILNNKFRVNLFWKLRFVIYLLFVILDLEFNFLFKNYFIENLIEIRN